MQKLGVLQKTVEEVSGRLEEAQKTVDTWAAVPQDPNLADQHVHNVRVRDCPFLSPIMSTGHVFVPLKLGAVKSLLFVVNESV